LSEPARLKPNAARPMAVLSAPVVRLKRAAVPSARVVIRIAAVWWRDNRLRAGQKRKADQPEYHQKRYGWSFELSQWMHG
jgi:hypothetical protein